MRASRDDAGFSLIELNLASVLSLIVLAAVGSLLVTILRDTTHVEARSRAQSEVSVAFDRLVVELREAQAPDTAGPYRDVEVRELSPTRLAFTVDAVESRDGEELVLYEVTNCAEGLCELVRTVTANGGMVSGVADYAGGTVLLQVPVVTNVVLPTPALPLFEGVDWGGGVRVVFASCDAAVPCDFDMVDIDIAIGIGGGGDRRNQSFTETVRMRNHGR